MMVFPLNVISLLLLAGILSLLLIQTNGVSAEDNGGVPTSNSTSVEDYEEAESRVELLPLEDSTARSEETGKNLNFPSSLIFQS